MSSSVARYLSDAMPFPADTRIGTVSIIGAGVMGRAIAEVSVRAGYHVKMTDADPQVAADAVRVILAESSSAPVNGPHFGQKSLPAVATVATTDAGIAAADLVIETIPENLDAKRAVLARIEPHLFPQTIVASNTSSILVADLAEALKAPERFCGLHFCHPVAERSLVEVIAAATTSDKTTKQACAFAVALGKSPVIVRDRPGFALNRILSPYLTESLELLLEGADVRLLDQAACEFGMPCGPLKHLDGFGIDVSLAVGANLLRAFPDRFIPSEMLVAMYKAGRLGRKSGGGFYSADHEGGDERIDPAVSDIITQRSRGTSLLTIGEVSRRLFLPMLLEATRVLEDSVVDSPHTIDILLRDGLGMTPESRGLFGWADAIGADTLIEWLQPFRPLGKRFAPTGLLLAAAADGVPLLKQPCQAETEKQHGGFRPPMIKHTPSR